MASFSLSQFLLPPRWNSKFILSGSLCVVQIPQYGVSSRLILSSSSKSKVVMSVAQGETIEGGSSKRKAPRAKGTTSRGANKASKVTQEDNSQLVEETDDKPKRPTPSKATSASAEEKVEKKKRGRKSKKSVVDKGEAPDSHDAEVSDVDSGMLTASEGDVEKTEKKSSRGRKSRKKVNKMDDERTDAEMSDMEKGIYNSDEDGAGSKTEKRSRGRRSKKKVDVVNAQASDAEASDVEGSLYVSDEDFSEEIDLELDKDEDEGISSTYKWPPLVCCFGAAQHCFVPSGRPGNRLVDYEIHQRLKDALWEPDNFVRAPGGSAGSVAIALASLGGRVAFMGKLGDDDWGQSMLYYLNVSNVQTRAVCIDTRRQTAVSKMKIAKRGGLRMTTSKPCAEDSLTRTEINIDLLKEAKMFYLSTSSLLDQNMRKTTLRALRIAKKLGSIIFYDLNLPFALWRSSEETKAFIQQVFNLADIIEVTKQELEFLCGITPSDAFEAKDRQPSKFIHYDPDVIAPLWHENLKVLFVTNGTSKLHYYTKDQDGAVVGMEDAPITPYTSDMSASGDGIVAALMRMLTVQPHLITDKDYLEHSLKYAMNCGVIDQWILGRQRGFPAMEGMEEEAVPDQYGITSLTEREFRTVAQVS